MLVLSRSLNQKVYLYTPHDGVCIVQISGVTTRDPMTSQLLNIPRVLVGFEAPASWVITREELR